MWGVPPLGRFGMFEVGSAFGGFAAFDYYFAEYETRSVGYESDLWSAQESRQPRLLSTRRRYPYGDGEVLRVLPEQFL